MGQKMWERNISVQVLGQGAGTVEIVGGVFAFNAAIKGIQETLHETLYALRFKRAQHRRIAGLSEE